MWTYTDFRMVSIPIIWVKNSKNNCVYAIFVLLLHPIMKER